MSATATKPRSLHERFDAGLGRNFHEKIDREQGIIRGVRILNLQSKNHRRYLREAVRDAVSLYESSKVYIDHKYEGDRSNRERWGQLKNVSVAADGGLVGDLHYLKQHPATEQILEAIERFGDFGLSHDTLGHSRRSRDGEEEVYEIVEVKSVDLVEDPATTKSLWESIDMSKSTRQRSFLRIMRENRQKVRFAEKFCENMSAMSDELAEMQMDDHMVEMDEEEYFEMDEEPGGDDAVKAGLRSAVMAIFDNDDDVPTTIRKITTLLKAGGEVGAASMPEAEGEDEGEEMLEADDDMEKKIEESVRRALKGPLGQLKKLKEAITGKSNEDELTALIESKGREATTERVALLVGTDAALHESLIASWDAKKTGRRPSRSPARHTEGKTGSYFDQRQSVRALKETTK